MFEERSREGVEIEIRVNSRAKKMGKYRSLIGIKKALSKEGDVLFIALLQREKLGRAHSRRDWREWEEPF